MKKAYTHLVCAALFIFPALCFSQTHYYNKRIPGLNFQFALPTADNCSLLFCRDTFVKLDSTGTIQWADSISFGGSVQANTCRFMDAFLCPDSTFAIAGTLYNTPEDYYTPGMTGFLSRLKANGDTLWNRRLTHSHGSVIPLSISPTNDQGFIICGTISPLDSLDCGFIAKLTGEGNLLWMKMITEVQGLSCYAASVKQTADSGFVLIGSQQDTPMLCRFDKTGNLVWNRKFIENDIDASYGMDVCVEGNGFLCLVSGKSQALIKTDTAGNISSQKGYQYAHAFNNPNIAIGYERSHKLHKTYSGSSFFMYNRSGIGYLIDSSGNTARAIIGSLDQVDLIQLKHRSFMIGGNQVPYFARSSQNWFDAAGYVITDTLANHACLAVSVPFTHTTTAYDTTWIHVLVDNGGLISAVHPTIMAAGCTTLSECAAAMVGGIRSNSLLNAAVFPNPSSGKIRLQADDLAGKKITFELIDYTGTCVMQLTARVTATTLLLDLGSIKESVYFYRLSADSGGTATGKLVIAH